MMHGDGITRVDYSSMAFIAPVDFDPIILGLGIDIIPIFNAYSNPDKRIIYLVSNVVASTPLDLGTSYRYSETIGGIETITDVEGGTVNWTTGSVKRYIIINNSATSMTVSIPSEKGVVWCYCGDFIITSIGSTNTYNTKYLKYIHCFDIHKILAISSFALESWPNNTVIIPSSCMSIADFIGYSKFIIIENGIKTIGSYAFYSFGSYLKGINEINNVILPESVETIGQVAFADNNLTGTGYIGAKVSSIGAGGIFRNSLSSITINSNNPYYCSEGCAIYNKNKTQVITTIGKFSGIWDIPNSVTSIRDWDCHGGQGISRINIPNSVTYIGNIFGQLCTGLTRVDCLNSTPPPLQDSFPHSIFSTCILHVPVGSLAAYQAATNWKNFVNIIADL